MTFAEDDLEAGKHTPELGPVYFDARRVVEKFLHDFETKQFSEMLKKFSEELYDKINDNISEFLLSDVESNLHLELRRMVDNCVNALLTGEAWALERYVLKNNFAYPHNKIREAIAKHIPVELQDLRIKTLEAENARLREDVEYYRNK